MKTCRTLIVLLLMLSAAACHRGGAAGEGKHSAQQRFEQAIAALDSDSVRTGELLLNDAIRLAHKDRILPIWHQELCIIPVFVQWLLLDPEHTVRSILALVIL